MIKKIYIAGPLFNAHERGFLEEIAHELEANGYDCFLPHRDQTGIEASELDGINMSQTTKDKIFNKGDLKMSNIRRSFIFRFCHVVFG